jgi:hypothetical protein
VPSLHGVQGQDAGHAPSLLVKVMRERGGRQTEEPDIRGMQEGGKRDRKSLAEDLEDSLRHLVAASSSSSREKGTGEGLGPTPTWSLLVSACFAAASLFQCIVTKPNS